MSQNSLRSFQISFADLGRWIMPLAIVLLLGAAGFGWLVKSFLVVMGLVILTPAVAFLGFRWWLSRSLVQSDCPVCHHEFVSLNKTEFSCPNCNEPLKAEHKHFIRLTPPGTIDVQAVEVSAQIVED